MLKLDFLERPALSLHQQEEEEEATTLMQELKTENFLMPNVTKVCREEWEMAMVAQSLWPLPPWLWPPLCPCVRLLG